MNTQTEQVGGVGTLAAATQKFDAQVRASNVSSVWLVYVNFPASFNPTTYGKFAHLSWSQGGRLQIALNNDQGVDGVKISKSGTRHVLSKSLKFLGLPLQIKAKSNVPTKQVRATFDPQRRVVTVDVERTFFHPSKVEPSSNIRVITKREKDAASRAAAREKKASQPKPFSLEEGSNLLAQFNQWIKEAQRNGSEVILKVGDDNKISASISVKAFKEL